MAEKGEIVVKEEETSIFQFDNPVQMVEVATEIANALSAVIEGQKLYKIIGKKKHVYVEGWTTLGFMTGVFATIEYTNKLEREPMPKRRPELVYEAKAVAKRADGTIIGVAEAMCSSYEDNWKGRDEYAIRSMAQTRAISKALRMPLGWIMTLKGYAGTPAEEMDGIKKPMNNGAKTAPKKPSKPIDDAIDVEHEVKQEKIITDDLEITDDLQQELCKIPKLKQAILKVITDEEILNRENIIEALKTQKGNTPELVTKLVERMDTILRG